MSNRGTKCWSAWWVPVEQYGRKHRDEAVGEFARPGGGGGAGAGLGQGFRFEGAEHGTAGAEYVHRVRVLGNLLQHGAQGGGKAAEPDELRLVDNELGGVGQAFVNQQVGDFLKGGAAGEVGDVVAAVMQVIA